MRLLLVEDESDIRQPLAASLREAGHAVDEAASAGEARGLAENYKYAVAIIDVSLPEGREAGFELAQSWRSAGIKTPILFLTARDSLADRIRGFDFGGDDYLVKPFHLEEVKAHLRALERRNRLLVETISHLGSLTIDWNKREVIYLGTKIHMTAKEYGILELLASHPGKLFSRSEIIEHIWDAKATTDPNIVDTYVKTLRKKLGEDSIKTVRGLGYAFREL